jgi:phosphocarrier protein HPr
MVSKHLTVKNPEGLNMRALVKIAKISRQQQCEVLLEKQDGQKADSNSLIEMLSLCAVSGTTLSVIAEGVNEQQTITLIEEVFENGAGI